MQVVKNTTEAVTRAIKDVASIRDYHRLDHDETDDQFLFEKKLGEIEGILSDALSTVLDNGISELQKYARICELVSLLRMRVPAMKNAIEEYLAGVVRKPGTILERTGQFPEPPKGLERALRMEDFDISISNWICLEHMFRLSSDKEIFRILRFMTPTVVRAPAGFVFVTCDQPVAIFNPDFRPTDQYGAGLLDRSTEISVPLSSTQSCEWDGINQSILRVLQISKK